MDKNIGMVSSIVNLLAVISFAICMLVGSDFGSYISSMFIAFGFVPMMCAFNTYGKKGSLTAGHAAIAFGAMYAVVIFLVYFAQVTTVRLDSLNEQSSQIINYQNFGLFFNYDLLGYCFMALATFFAGLTIEAKTKPDKWLKALLIIHGVFAISCLIIPMLGMFSKNMAGGDITGILVLEFWCIYFIPIGILSTIYFKKSFKN